MDESVVRNDNLRSDVTVIEETPDLDRLGKAGARLKVDRMLMAHHGQPAEAWQRLSADERDVLRQIAVEEDSELGISHQADAIGALAEMRDEGSLLLLSKLARDQRADTRIQIAATYALGEIGGDQVRSELRDLLRASAPEVRAQAVYGLAKAGTGADLIELEAIAERDQTFVRDIARRAGEALRARIRLA
jgi:HEAT repeat protein